MKKSLSCAVVFACLSVCAAEAPAFLKASPVWPASCIGQTNVQLRLSASFTAGDKALLRIAGADEYRILLNGEFVWHGPARACRGYFRVDEIPLASRAGANRLEIVIQGNNNANFCFALNEPFVQAEVAVDGRPVVWTASDGGGFTVRRTTRLQRASRYSHQRPFAEFYTLGGPVPEPLKFAAVGPKRLLARIAPPPSFAVNSNVVFHSRARRVILDKRRPTHFRFDEVAGDVAFRSWDLCLRLMHTNRVAIAPTRSPVRLAEGESVRVDAGLNDSGFTGLRVEVVRPGRLLFSFDELLTDGEAVPDRLACCNLVVWDFMKPGVYEIETFEPYVWRYGDFSADRGEFVLGAPYVRGYKNGEASRAKFRSSDPALDLIFKAARETFAQNAVDVFTDCPSRERAGWLCDSFFLGRMNRLLCGNTALERLFLENYMLPESFGFLPKGMLPMCYPAHNLQGRFIPNWAMWLVIETEEYLGRSGDRAMIDAMRPRFTALVEYLRGFRNSDGLLEKLPSWVFVEWSRANKLVQDVNYPSNMTFAEVLDVMNRLYDMPEYAAEAARMRETIRRQSWTGKWFCDNAVRQADGTLRLSGECTETCQYYAFFFGTATRESHPELWKTLVEEFGPRRLKTKAYPEVWPSNAFIGNYLRLELLSQAGNTAAILDETKDFFFYMAERTGTLWEYISPLASCDHGFASYAAMFLVRDVVGVREIDPRTKTVVFEPPQGLSLAFCECELPLTATEKAKFSWKLRSGRPEASLELPPGWRLRGQ